MAGSATTRWSTCPKSACQLCHCLKLHRASRKPTSASALIRFHTQCHFTTDSPLHDAEPVGTFQRCAKGSLLDSGQSILNSPHTEAVSWSWLPDHAVVPLHPSESAFSPSTSLRLLLPAGEPKPWPPRWQPALLVSLSSEPSRGTSSSS